MTGVWILTGMFLFIGGLFTWLGCGNLMTARKRYATWMAVQGTVTGLAEVPGSKGSTLYAPVYRYYFDNSEHTVTSDTASSPPDYKEGDPIQLLVNPMNAGESMVMDRTASIFSYGILAAGLISLAVGLLLAWLAATGQLK
jgi:hypothetical protein